MKKALKNENRIVALDVGSLYVGIAIIKGDAGKRYSLKRAKNHAVSQLIDLFSSEKGVVCVVGMPFHVDGSLSEQGRDILSFCRRLKRRSCVEIFLVDEAYSTQEAIDQLKLQSAQKREKAKSSGELDAYAAEIIGKRYVVGPPSYEVYALDDFLDSLGDTIAQEESLEQD